VTARACARATLIPGLANVTDMACSIMALFSRRVRANRMKFVRAGHKLRGKSRLLSPQYKYSVLVTAIFTKRSRREINCDANAPRGTD